MYEQIKIPKKIVHIITGLSVGGAEKMLYNLLAKTNRDRFAPIVISLMGHDTLGEAIEALGIPVYSLGMQRTIPKPNVSLRLIQTIRKIQPDLIQGWMYHGNLAAQFANTFNLRKIPVIWAIHHSINSLKSEKLMTQAVIKLSCQTAKFINKIVFVSSNSKLQHEILGCPSKNSCVIPNGFDTNLFQPAFTAKLKISKELNIPPETLLIGLMARYHPMKDHANFLTAAAILLKEHPDVHFLLAGTNVDHENKELSKLIDALEIRPRIHLLGERNDMPHLLAALDIVTLASAYGEAFPLVIGEAMSCSVPCVVTDIGDSAWIVGETGKVVPPKNAIALARAWQELIDLGAENRQVLGKAARSRIIESFSIEAVVAEYEKLYDRLLISNPSWQIS